MCITQYILPVGVWIITFEMVEMTDVCMYVLEVGGEYRLSISTLGSLQLSGPKQAINDLVFILMFHSDQKI